MATVIALNTTTNGIYINDLGEDILFPGSAVCLSDYYPLSAISKSSLLLNKVLMGDVAISNGISYYPSADGVEYLRSFTTTLNPKDRSGKIRVHQTSRKLGLSIGWTGVGDLVTDPCSVGDGESFSIRHKVGDEAVLTKYIDFNCVENDTWLHEGYITWSNCDLDMITLEVLPRVVDVASSSGTNYTMYHNYLVVPAPNSTGNIDILSDITTHSGGLVYMPNDDLNNRPLAFWDADWDIKNKQYINIRPTPKGDGRYNIFSKEVIFARYINMLTLLDSGFIALSSSDTSQLGQGLRIRLISRTNMDVGDHEWAMASTMCLHRKRSI